MLGKIYKLIHSQASLNKQETRQIKLIVSMTTIPPRISKVHQVIWRLLEQTVKPDKIIIYLGKDKFQGVNLPYVLKLQMKLFGVEVRYVEDIGPHTKYFHAITEFKNDSKDLYKKFMLFFSVSVAVPILVSFFFFNDGFL